MFIKDKYKNDLAQQFAMITFYCAYTQKYFQMMKEGVGK